MPEYTDKQLGYARAVVAEGRRLGITGRASKIVAQERR